MATKIFTRTGDDGTTSLVAGRRVAKYDLRVDVYGTVDELISVVGLVRSAAGPLPVPLAERLLEVQGELMALAARLATEDETERERLPALPAAASVRLEQEIDGWTAAMPELTAFLLPGGTAAAAFLHQCRTVCRRAERRVAALHVTAPLPAELRVYLNRLSDWFFTLARYLNHLAGVADVRWTPRRPLEP